MIVSMETFRGNLLSVGLLTLAATGVLALGDYNFLNATPIFEVLFFILAISSFFFSTKSRGAQVVQIMFIAYLIINYGLMVISETKDIKDFLQINKAFIYAPFLVMFLGANAISNKKAVSLFKVLLLAFLFKYLLSVLLGYERPGIFTENNFELSFLMLLYMAISDSLGDKKLKYFLALSIVVALSGSRSAMIALIALYFFVFLRHFSIKIILRLIPFIVLSLLAAYIFIDRMVGDIYTIDRVKFLDVFLLQIEGWSWYDYIFGSYPITSIDTTGCMLLAYYSSLFSYSGDGSCYSVILHSYFLRVIFDHGLFGLCALIAFYIWIFKRAGVEKWKLMGFLALVFCNSLSVSAVNSVYFCLGLIFLLESGKWDCTSKTKADHQYAHTLKRNEC
jgi:hypothetical protein